MAEERRLWGESGEQTTQNATRVCFWLAWRSLGPDTMSFHHPPQDNMPLYNFSFLSSFHMDLL